MYKQLYMSVDIEITTMVRTRVIQPLSAVQTHPSSALSQIFNFSHCSVTLNIAGNHSSRASVGQSMLSYQKISSFRIWLRFRCIVQINTFWTFLLFAATIDRLQFNWIKPCNVVNCIFRIIMFIGSIGQLRLWRHWKGFIAGTSCSNAIPSKILPLSDE